MKCGTIFESTHRNTGTYTYKLLQVSGGIAHIRDQDASNPHPDSKVDVPEWFSNRKITIKRQS